jgi:hypothetical protein
VVKLLATTAALFAHVGQNSSPRTTKVGEPKMRTVARAAGVPDHVWNMDARAGGISEGDDAGADLNMLRSAAGHTQASTTARYVRGTIGKSRKVAELRQAHREAARKHDVNDK